MSQTQTFILAIGGIQGFLLFILLVTDERVNQASKILGFYCLFLTTTFMLPLIVAAGESNYTWLIGILVFLPACYGALIYLYCQTAITHLPLKSINLFHFLPLGACYLINYDILFSPTTALDFVTRAPDFTALRTTLTTVIFFGQAFVYTVLTMEMIKNYQIKAKHTLSSYNPDTFKWLWSLIIFTIVIWGLKGIFGVLNIAPIANILADFLLVVAIYFIAIVHWRNPSLFHIQHLKAQLEQSAIQSSNQLSNGVLDQELRSSILKLVQDQVKEQALYRNSELTLATLSEIVGVSVHHLSETLNQSGGKNFNRFINDYRVAEVCQQLDQRSERNLINLALDAGFSSKSSFNAIFKKLTGQTPSQYKQQLSA